MEQKLSNLLGGIVGQTVFTTNFEPAEVAKIVTRSKLAAHRESLLRLASFFAEVDLEDAAEALQLHDPSEEEAIVFMVDDGYLPAFDVQFTIAGICGDAVWGHVSSRSMVVAEVKRRLEMGLVENDAVLAMDPVSGFGAVACLVTSPYGFVELRVDAKEGEFDPDEEEFHVQLLAAT